MIHSYLDKLLKDIPVPPGWNPMTTAPRNATWVQVIMEDGTINRAHWASDLSGEDCPPFEGWFSAYEKREHGFYEIGDPVGWRIDKPANDSISNQRMNDADDLTAITTQFYTNLVQEFVTGPLGLRVTCDVNTLAVVVQPDPSCVSDLIGKGGRMVDAMRVILGQLARRYQRHSLIYEVKDDMEFVPRHGRSFVPRSDWPEERVMGVITKSVSALFVHPVTSWVRNEEKRHKTHLEVIVSPQEEVDNLRGLADALGLVIHAVGMPHGRLIFLEKLERRKK